MERNKGKKESKEQNNWEGLGFVGGVGVGVDKGSGELVISEKQFVQTGIDDQGRKQYVRDTVRIKVPMSELGDFIDKVRTGESRLKGAESEY